MRTNHSLLLNAALLIGFVVMLGFAWDYQESHIAAVQAGCERQIAYDKSGDPICPQL